MRQWIGESLKFLYWLGLLQLARLAVVLICIVEVIAVLGLWGWAIAKCSASLHMAWLWIPVAATFFVAVQVSLGSSPGCGLRSVAGIGEPSPNAFRRWSATLFRDRLTLGNDNRRSDQSTKKPDQVRPIRLLLLSMVA